MISGMRAALERIVRTKQEAQPDSFGSRLGQNSVVFLDIDGVMNSRETRNAESGDCDIHGMPADAMLDRLARIVQATGAAIVLSSTWRIAEHTRKAAEVSLATRNLSIVGCTPDLEAPCQGDRVDEIIAWLRGATHVDSWVAIDDMDLLAMNSRLDDAHFVRTSDLVGLTDEKAEEATRKLQKQRRDARPVTRIGVLGDSTCSVRETADAIADGCPYFYCDPRLGHPGLDFRIAEHGSHRLQIWPSGGRERFRSLAQARQRFSTAVLVVYNTHDDFGERSYARNFAEGALAAGARVALIPAAHVDADAPPFPEEAKERARQFAARERAATGRATRFRDGAMPPPNRIEFHDVSSCSPPEQLSAVLDALLV